MVDMDVVMTLLVSAKVVWEVWSYDIYVMTLCHWIAASSYDNKGYKENSMSINLLDLLMNFVKFRHIRAHISFNLEKKKITYNTYI